MMPQTCPNPWCRGDGKPSIAFIGSDWSGGSACSFHVHCPSCGLSAPTGFSREQAVAAWNNITWKCDKHGNEAKP